MDLFQQCESDFLRVVGLMKRHESSSGAGRRPDELLREAEELVRNQIDLCMQCSFLKFH